jgi:hypothetical protein
VNKTAADCRLKIDRAGTVLTGALRRTFIEPSENLIAIIERIATQSYSPEVAQHVAEQLGELADGINYKLGERAHTIERLSTGLSAFEERLFDMSRAPGR